MRKILFLIVFFFVSGSIRPNPAISFPVVIIDCGHANSVLADSCFKFIQLATNRLNESGVFTGIRSISNHSFLYRKADQIYPINLSDNSNYKDIVLRKFLNSRYQSEMSMLADKTFRYAVIYATALPAADLSCASCTEVRDTLAYSKIRTWFYNEADFNQNLKSRFDSFALRIAFDLTNSVSLYDPDIFFRLLALQNRLYSLSGVKIVYSAVNVSSFLASVIFTNPEKTTPEKKWKDTLAVWELGGERRSQYIDFSEKILYIDIHSNTPASTLLEPVSRLLRNYSTDIVTDWFIYNNQMNIIAKKDDATKKENKLASDETDKKTPGKNQPVQNGNKISPENQSTSQNK